MKEIIDVVARDGTSLSATWFVANSPQDKVVLITSATGVKQSYYLDFACWLAEQGFSVYTFDYRGIGKSRPENLNLLLCDMKDWSKDVDAMICHIGSMHPRSQVILIGHSVGGQLIGMSQLARHVDTFVMIGSQTPYWKNYSGAWLRMKLYLLWNALIPLLVPLFGYFPGSILGLLEDLPSNVALQWARWATSRNYIFDELPGDRRNFEGLTQRTLMVSFSDDVLAPRRAVTDLQRFYKNLKFEHWHLHPEDIMQKKIGHFGFFRKRMEALLWRDVVSWIYKTLSTPTKKAA